MSPYSASVTGVLEQFTQSSKDGRWLIEKLAEGTHATVYSIRSQDNQPIWQTHRALAVKLYKPAGARNGYQFVREQFDSLSRLYAVVDGSIINGWKIFSPAPLYLCKSPLALVMSMVPGRKISLYLDAGDDASFAIMDSLPWVIIAAMERYWSVGQTHGDLNFDNILCDIADRDLSFVDVGMRTTSPLVESITKCCHPASHDLGYMLYETGVKVTGSFGNPRSCLRQQRFAEGVLRAYIETAGPSEDKQRLLDEIRACARMHLKNLDWTLSWRGLWHVFVRHVASRRVDRLLARLRNNACLPGNRRAA